VDGIDELFYVDSVASLYGRNSLNPIIERTAREVFIPLTVGGGLRSVEDIRAVLRAGADKVSLNTAAVRNPDLIREAAERFGSSTIVVSITTMKHPEHGRHVVYTDYGREDSNVEALEWALRAVELGAGELLVTSVDREGTGRGYDGEIIRRIAEAVPVPVIAGGGAGTVEHLARVIEDGKADAVCVASLLHYKVFKEFSYKPEDFSEEGNTVLIGNRAVPAGISPASAAEIKADWVKRGIPCRPSAEILHA